LQTNQKKEMGGGRSTRKGKRAKTLGGGANPMGLKTRKKLL
jgi:hypothetical protein